MAAFAPLIRCAAAARDPSDPLGRVGQVALALLAWSAAASNRWIGIRAGRDDRRGSRLVVMYAWDWVALALSALGGATLFLAGSQSREFPLGISLATFAAILMLSAAIRRRLAALQPSLANIVDVFR